MSSSLRPPQTSGPHPDFVFVVNCLRRLGSTFKATHSLSSDDLSWLNIKCTQVGLDSGTPNDGGFKVVEPKPLNEMDAIAERNNLINVDDVYRPGEYSTGNFYEASTLGDFFFHEFLEKSDALTKKPLVELGSWKLGPNENDEHCTADKIGWRVAFTLHSHDDSMPADTIRFLPQSMPIKHDELLFSELWCILKTSARQLKKNELGPDGIAPVTIVSASGRDLRIVQGYIHNNKVLVRMSEVVNTDQEDEQNLNQLMKVGAWLLGAPCRYQA
ncbi:hypothetical protein GGR53DRAFT_463090 [Hypoxylon sp. FL1150]|nr:hypothetical protein GGR53DRAFT_463090 [Hypoxylon sp. FL1150]